MIKQMYLITICLLVLSITNIWASDGLQIPDSVKKKMEQLPDPIDFNFHVKPILSDRCFTCHGPDENARMMNLRLDTEEGATGPLLIGDGAAVVPHKPEDSVMVHRILSENHDTIMPPVRSNLSLDDHEKALLIKWIEQGGEYKQHWSFIPLPESLKNFNLPEEADSIDWFIGQKHHEQGLTFSPPAEKDILLRRVTFDLTGLPPTLAEIDAFINDESPDAFEKVVDRLLSSPAYGEHMAVEWLDLARYADTYGYQADNYRPMWRWRDWVIGAFNDNMPYDQFVTWQLAGDLMPNPTVEQRLATGFNRNHQQNAEGGIINEEYRVEYVADRTNTFGKALLGVTMECARCHDHKYDPISEENYYEIFAFFNNVDEAGQITWYKNDIPSPSMLLPTEAETNQLEEYNQQLKRVKQLINSNKKDAQADFLNWFESIQGSTKPIDIQSRIAVFSLDDFSPELIASEIGDATGRIVDPVSLALVDEIQPVDGKRGKAFQTDGDMMLDFPGIGKFKKGEDFAIAAWVQVPPAVQNGVIFHGNRGGIIYSFKGYQVSVEEDVFDIRLAHTFPYNAIHVLTNTTVPRDEWFHVALSYDGSGKAEGVTFYLNGEPQELTIKRDNLYKEMQPLKGSETTNLRAGARWRSKGLTHGKIDQLEVFDRALTPLGAKLVYGDNKLFENTNMPLSQMNEPDYNQWFEFYLNNYNDTHINLLAQQEQLRNKQNAIQDDIEEVMVMVEMDPPRQAYVLNRGAYDSRGKKVEPSTPDSILPFGDYPNNRLGLAQWLFDEQNPLTARVVVNRLWKKFFGTGLVKTAEDFGNQGELPSHPRLLDWLSYQLINQNWDIQALQKMMVLSKTYQQSSLTRSLQRDRDPENQWLARGPNLRLSAEMLRDMMLASSGLLVNKIGGPSVKPYQPEGLWSFGTNSNYDQGTGDDLYRRSLYTFWKRTVPPPSMNIFDAPERSTCIVSRSKTNTPLQALALMNDPQYIEASRALAFKVMSQTDNHEKRLVNLFRSLTTKPPDEHELSILKNLYDKQHARFQEAPESMEGFLKEGEMRVECEEGDASLATYTVIASAILNSDKCIMKR